MRRTLLLVAILLPAFDQLLGPPDDGLCLTSAISFVECTLLPLYTEDACLQDQPPVNLADLQAVPIEE